MMRAALLAACMACTVARAEVPALGRLFYTPAERAQLDAGRTPQASPAPPPLPEPAVTATPPAPPAPVVLDGMVRHDGKSTVWLNQAAHEQRGAAAAWPLRLPSGRVVLLRPGQRYDPASGSVKEAHEP